MQPAARLSPAPTRRLVLGAALLLLAMSTACAPEIGDQCRTSRDCSSAGTRLCDRTQPHGYCTLQGCEEGTCPDEAVCVKFSPDSERLSSTYCMFKCSSGSDCRSDEGYQCLRAMATGKDPKQLSDPGAFGDGIEADVLGSTSQKFCAVRSELPAKGSADAGMPPVNDENDGSAAIQSGG
jgi:hypothetical protein